MFMVEVKLLSEDEAPLQLEVTNSCLGRALFNQVIDRLNGIVAKDYFGLRYLDQNKQRQWLEMTKTVYKQLKHVTPRSLNFRVKHYPCNPMEEFLQEKARYLLYLQLRRDLHSGRLIGRNVEMQILAACILQAEIGDSDILEEYLGDNGTLTDLKMFANINPKTESKIYELHKALKGMSTEEAESKFLQCASQFDTYGVEPLYVQDRKGNHFYMGINHEGVITFRGSRKAHVFSWQKINKISYEGKLFIIQVEWEQRRHTLGFKCPTAEAAEALWKWAVDRQCFLTLTRSVDAKESKANGGVFKRRQFHTFTGRCQRELMLLNASLPTIPQPTVTRSRSLFNLAKNVGKGRQAKSQNDLDTQLGTSDLNIAGNSLYDGTSLKPYHSILVTRDAEDTFTKPVSNQLGNQVSYANYEKQLSNSQSTPSLIQSSSAKQPVTVTSDDATKEPLSDKQDTSVDAVGASVAKPSEGNDSVNRNLLDAEKKGNERQIVELNESALQSSKENLADQISNYASDASEMEPNAEATENKDEFGEIITTAGSVNTISSSPLHSADEDDDVVVHSMNESHTVRFQIDTQAPLGPQTAVCATMSEPSHPVSDNTYTIKSTAQSDTTRSFHSQDGPTDQLTLSTSTTKPQTIDGESIPPGISVTPTCVPIVSISSVTSTRTADSMLPQRSPSIPCDNVITFSSPSSCMDTDPSYVCASFGPAFMDTTVSLSLVVPRTSVEQAPVTTVCLKEDLYFPFAKSPKTSSVFSNLNNTNKQKYDNFLSTPHVIPYGRSPGWSTNKFDGQTKSSAYKQAHLTDNAYQEVLRYRNEPFLEFNREQPSCLRPMMGHQLGSGDQTQYSNITTAYKVQGNVVHARENSVMTSVFPSSGKHSPSALTGDSVQTQETMGQSESRIVSTGQLNRLERPADSKPDASTKKELLYHHGYFPKSTPYTRLRTSDAAEARGTSYSRVAGSSAAHIAAGGVGNLQNTLPITNWHLTCIPNSDPMAQKLKDVTTATIQTRTFGRDFYMTQTSGDRWKTMPFDEVGAPVTKSPHSSASAVKRPAFEESNDMGTFRSFKSISSVHTDSDSSVKSSDLKRDGYGDVIIHQSPPVENKLGATIDSTAEGTASEQHVEDTTSAPLIRQILYYVLVAFCVLKLLDWLRLIPLLTQPHDRQTGVYKLVSAIFHLIFPS